MIARLLATVAGWWTRHQRDVWIAALLAVVAAVLLEVGKYQWSGPDSYKIGLVGDLHNPQTLSVFNTFEARANQEKLELDGTPIVVTKIDDEGSSDRAKALAESLKERPDTLLVLGSVRSQGTKESIPIYMGASPRIPVIATTESDDDLLGLCSSCDSDYVPVLQMSPTNRAQAESAVKYGEESGCKKFLIAYDVNTEENHDYSRDLQRDYRTVLDALAYRNLIVAGTIQMGEPPSVGGLAKEAPDCVLYAGEPGPAHSLVAALQDYASQVNSTKKSPRRVSSIPVILSDASVNPGMVTDALNNFKTVYYTFASNAAYYRSNSNVFGTDAFSIVRELVTSSNEQGSGWGSASGLEQLRKFLGIRRVIDARADIVRSMERYALLGHVYPGDSGEQYQFAGFRRQSALFHVWAVQEASVKDVDGWHKPIQQQASSAENPMYFRKQMRQLFEPPLTVPGGAGGQPSSQQHRE